MRWPKGDRKAGVQAGNPARALLLTDIAFQRYTNIERLMDSHFSDVSMTPEYDTGPTLPPPGGEAAMEEAATQALDAVNLHSGIG